MITTILTIIGGVTVIVIVIVGLGAWLLSGLKPGDVP